MKNQTLGTPVPRQLTPARLALRAALIALSFAVCHLLGLRRFTSVLSGTTGGESTGLIASGLMGVLYVLTYLALVFVAPVLLGAAGLLILMKGLRHEPGGETHAQTGN